MVSALGLVIFAISASVIGHLNDYDLVVDPRGPSYKFSLNLLFLL
jgi:hypothetical protein